MNIFKYSLMLLALSIGSQQLLMPTMPPGMGSMTPPNGMSMPTMPPPSPADPFYQGNSTILSDFTILSNAVNQDPSVNQNLWNAIYLLGYFISSYLYVTPDAAASYWPGAVSTTDVSTMGNNLVTLMNTIWTALCKNLAPEFKGTIQTTLGQSSNCPTQDTVIQISAFGGVLDYALGQNADKQPAAFLSPTQLATIQNTINGTQPVPTATAAPLAPASDAGTVNGVLNNYYYLCPITTTVTISGDQNTPPPQVTTNTKTIVLAKGKSASSVATKTSTKTVALKKGTGTITAKPIKQATVTKVVKTTGKK